MPHRPAREPRRQQIASRPILFDGGINLLDPAQVHANQHVAGRNWFRGEDMVIRPRPGNLPWDRVSGVNPVPPPAPPPVVFSPDAVLARLNQGTHWTQDSGATWTSINGPLSSSARIDVWWVGASTVWATSGAPDTEPRRLRKSTDKGQNFSIFGTQVHTVREPKSAIIVIPSTGRMIVGLTTEGAPDDTLAVAFSDNEGTSWTTATVGSPALVIGQLRQHSLIWVAGTTVMLVARAADGVSREHLFRSTDAGATWGRVGPVMTFDVRRMNFLWKDPQTGFLFCPSSTQAPTAAAYTLYRSADQGATWAEVDTGAQYVGLTPVRSQIARWSDGRLIWMLPTGFSPFGRQSNDNGATWTAYTPPTPIFAGVYRLKDVLIAARDSAGTDGWRSTDGTNWVVMSGFPGVFGGFASPVTGGA